MCKATRPPSGMRAREPCVGRSERRSPHRLAAFGPSAKSVHRSLFLSYQFSPTFSHSPHSALSSRAHAASLAFGGSSAALGNGSAVFGPSAKSVHRSLFLLYQFSPTFSHSPHSVLGAVLRAPRLGFGGSSAALGNGSARSGPLQKVCTDPYFYSTSFPPLFPPLRPRRSGAVLRSQNWRRATRAPRSGTDRRLPALCKKCRQTPIFTLPVFPHFSPLSPLGAQGPCGACARVPSGREASCGAEVPLPEPAGFVGSPARVRVGG